MTILKDYKIFDMAIYTKTGDKGETSLIGGTRVPKYHERIEVYGTLDELNSFVGLVRDQTNDESIRKVLLLIQQNIYTAGTLIATDPVASENSSSDSRVKGLTSSDISFLENEIDLLTQKLPPLRSFILPGGHPLSSYTHIARTICRRAERLILQMSKKHTVDYQIIMYFNRLSDYFFVLARWFVIYNKAEEISWSGK